MDRMHDDGTFSNAGRDPLDRIGTHIADGKDARDARGVRRRQRLTLFYTAGFYKPFRIKINAAVEPIGIRHGTNHEEKIRR